MHDSQHALAIFWRRSVRPIVTDPTTLRLSLGLHGGRARKTRIEHEGLKAIVSTEGVNRRQCYLRIERLHRTCGVFRRHKRD